MGADATAVRDALMGIWRQRTDRYSMERSEKTVSDPKVEMSYIGG
jgi:hypothetical protein